MTTPRRRGAPATTGPRRRTTAATPPGAPATHNKFSSTSTGGTGYGYSNNQQMQNSYAGSPGGYPKPTGYGYSGASSYGSSNTGGKSNALMYAGAGFVAGVGSYYLYNRLTRSTCLGYSCCSGCSNSCYDGQRQNCNQNMNKQYYQDDIMQDGGFYPNELSPPLKVRITEVIGTGYVLDDICPPVGCNSEDCAVPTVEPNDLFVTLTEMNELSDDTLSAVSSAFFISGSSIVAGSAMVQLLLN